MMMKHEGQVALSHDDSSRAVGHAERFRRDARVVLGCFA
jgi:hypothetical protein